MAYTRSRAYTYSCIPIQYPYYCFTHDVIKIIRSFNKRTRRTRPQYKNICVFTSVRMYVCMYVWYIYTPGGYRIYIGSKAKGAIYWFRGIVVMRFIFHF